MSAINGKVGRLCKAALDFHRPGLRLDFGVERPADRLASGFAHLSAPIGTDLHNRGHDLVPALVVFVIAGGADRMRLRDKS